MALFRIGWGEDLQMICVLLVCFLMQIIDVSADVIINNSDNSTVSILSMPSTFGALLPPAGLTGYLAIADPLTACDRILPPPENFSNFDFFALIRRGSCNFDKKVLLAQESGYRGAIVFNNENNGIFPMTAESSTFEIAIPSVFVGLDGGGILFESDYTTGATVTMLPQNSIPVAYVIYFYTFLSVIVLCLLLPAIFGIAKFIRDRRRLRRIRLSKDHLKKLPVIKFKKGDDRYDVCAICLDEYEEGNKLRILPCQHAFHCKCIDPWLTNNRRTCPICKRKVVPPGVPDSDEESDDSTDENTPLLGGSSNRSSPIPDDSQFGAVGGQRRPSPEVFLDPPAPPPICESYDSGIVNNAATDKEDDSTFELAGPENEPSQPDPPELELLIDIESSNTPTPTV